MMLCWDRLLNPVRRKELAGNSRTMGTGANRTEIERDYDRILFATPTRRLADKTQVFPLEENDSVRNRLTHSQEVSNLARSIGVRLAFEYPDLTFGEDHERLGVKRNIPSLLAAVGLAHDLGNPPFGHQGEVAIQQWFRASLPSNSNESIEDDFLEFDGNAQTFRLLTRLQILNDRFGLNLTVATLAALVKYPTVYGSNDKCGFKKHGIFRSEQDIFAEVWEQTGLSCGVRHPLAYVMEACDDIAYSIIDAEDTVKKGYASFYDLMDHLKSSSQGDPIVRKVIADATKKNKEFKRANLSSRELNDISMQMFRVAAISSMIPAATDVFVRNIGQMLSGEIEKGFDLISSSECNVLCDSVKNFDRRYGFQNMDVLRLELEGNSYIKGMMSMVWRAIKNGEDKSCPFERYVFGAISENYRRIYDSSDKTEYCRRQLLCDVVSGMTETYLIKKHDEFKSLDRSSQESTFGEVTRESPPTS